jgi:hypothetical protein
MERAFSLETPSNEPQPEEVGSQEPQVERPSGMYEVNEESELRSVINELKQAGEVEHMKLPNGKTLCVVRGKRGSLDCTLEWMQEEGSDKKARYTFRDLYKRIVAESEDGKRWKSMESGEFFDL